MSNSFRPGRLSPLQILERLFPGHPGSVLNLVLQGCNGDLVTAIEHFLSAKENTTLKTFQPQRSFSESKTQAAYSPTLSDAESGMLHRAESFSRHNSISSPGNTIEKPPINNTMIANVPLKQATDWTKPFDFAHASSNINSCIKAQVSSSLPYYSTRSPNIQTSLLNAFTSIPSDFFGNQQRLFPSALPGMDKFSSFAPPPVSISANTPNSPFLLPFGFYQSYPSLLGQKPSIESHIS